MKRLFFLMSMVAICVWADVHEERFSQIYTNAEWGTNNKGEGHSGWGSTPENCTEYMSFLENFLREKNITSVVDAGCGDWQFSRLMNWTGIRYIGYDVVPKLIVCNNAKYATDEISFVHANFLTTDLPSADLFLCKDVFQHLTNADIQRFIPQLKKFKYCLITNEINPLTLTSNNADTRVGGFRRLDLSKPPFNLKGKGVLNYKVWREVHQVFFIDNTVG
jgi:2-polyprenyl-3-methyl-5-hydroxy-6-metoxy-1,4-benzoquinol methylase